ncbi:hypothetical protein D910_01646, partial [Dendroctonus ponderosae]
MKSLGDDSLPIDVTRDERMDSNKMIIDSNMLPPQHIEDSISPEHISGNYTEYIKKYTSDNIDINRHPINIGFLVSFLVDARGGAMRGCRHSGVRVIVPPRPQRTPHPPPLMEGEALASRVLELGPVGAQFLGPVIIEVPHFAALRGKEREIVILRSDNGESWKEHTVKAAEDILNEVLHESFEAEEYAKKCTLSDRKVEWYPAAWFLKFRPFSQKEPLPRRSKSAYRTYSQIIGSWSGSFASGDCRATKKKIPQSHSVEHAGTNGTFSGHDQSIQWISTHAQTVMFHNREAIHVPFMAKFVVFAKRVDPLEARLRVFCMTDDKEDKTLEHQEHFTEVAKSRDVEVLEGKSQYIEFAGNLVPITKSGEQLQFSFRAFRENRLPFSVRVKDQHAEAVGRCLFMREAKILKGEPPQQPICILNIVLPDDIVTDTISLTDSESGKRHMYLSEFQDYYRPDPRLADMSNLLGDDWVELAYQLGLTSSEINVIKSEYPESIAKQAQSMLRMWLSQSGNKAQTNTLENALRRIGREDIIPQCLNVEQPTHTFTRIKEQEIGYRLKKKDENDLPDVFWYNFENSSSNPMFLLAIASSASPQDDDDSLDTDGFREDQYLLQTPTPGDSSPESKSKYLDKYEFYREEIHDIDAEEVTAYEDVTRYYEHQAKLFIGQRKRLASTEDLDNADVIDTLNSTSELLPSNRDNDYTGIVKIGLDSFKIASKDLVRPDALLVKCYTSPEEKGAKDSKRPEDWERKERKTVERLHGGAGKDKVVPTEEHVYLKTTTEKVTLNYTDKIASTSCETDESSVKITASASEKIKHDYSEDANSDKQKGKTPGLPKLDKHIIQVHQSTSPPSKHDLDPTPDVSPIDQANKPTLELIIGRKEVKTKDASATAESRLTLYGRKDVEISIKSQSHISVTTIRRDNNAGTETSEKFDVGFCTTAGTDKVEPLTSDKTIQMDDYIISPTKKREESVNFSGTKQVYTYETTNDLSEIASSASEGSASHHVTDTGISLTRGTTTETLSIGRNIQGPGIQTTGFISDTVEVEEGECTDAGLSPIQADETLHQEIDDLTLLIETGTSPIEFGDSISLVTSHIDTSDAGTITDHVDTKDASNSPIKIEESPILSAADILKDEEILAKRRGSGDVKAKIKQLEEHAFRHAIKSEFRKPKRDIVDSEDEISSMKEEEALRASTETLAQVDDEEYKMESISEHIVKEQVEDFSEKSLSVSKTATPTHTKHVGKKIAELQKMFTSENLETQVKIVPNESPISIPSEQKQYQLIKSEETMPIQEPHVGDVDEDENEVFRSVRDKRNLFEELISKSQEGTPVKKPSPKKKDIPAPEYTEQEILVCLKSLEEQVLEEKQREMEYQLQVQEERKKWEKKETSPTEPCVEPECVKIRIEPKLDFSGETTDNGSQLPVSKLKHLYEQRGIATLSDNIGTDIKTSYSPSEAFGEAKLVSPIDSATGKAKSEQSVCISTLEESIIRKSSPQTLDFSITERYPSMNTEVKKIMSEVLEASKQIREDVKELKPDLTPTPDGQLVQLIPSESLEKIKDLKTFEVTIKPGQISYETEKITIKLHSVNKLDDMKEAVTYPSLKPLDSPIGEKIDDVQIATKPHSPISSDPIADLKLPVHSKVHYVKTESDAKKFVEVEEDLKFQSPICHKVTREAKLSITAKSADVEEDLKSPLLKSSAFMADATLPNLEKLVDMKMTPLDHKAPKSIDAESPIAGNENDVNESPTSLLLTPVEIKKDDVNESHSLLMLKSVDSIRAAKLPIVVEEEHDQREALKSPLSKSPELVKDAKLPIVEKVDDQKEALTSPLPKSPGSIKDAKLPIVEKLDDQKVALTSPLPKSSELVKDAKLQIVENADDQKEALTSTMPKSPESIKDAKLQIDEKV